MKGLFELRHERNSLIAKAEGIMNAAKGAGREMTREEAAEVDGFLDQAKALAPAIQESENVNTILQYDPRKLAMGALVRRGEQDPARAAAQNPIPQSIAHPKEVALKRSFSAWSKRVVGNLTGMPQADDAYNPAIEATSPSGAISIGTGTNLDSVNFAIPTEVLPFQKSYLEFSPFEKANSWVISTQHMRPINLPVISAGTPPSSYSEGAGPAQGPTGSTPFGMSGFTFGAQKFIRQVIATWESLQSTETPLQPAIIDELLASMANVLTQRTTQQLYAALTTPPNYTIPTGGLPPCQIGGSGVQADNYGLMTSLRHSLPEGFEDPNDCCWMLSRNTLAIIRNTRASTSGVVMFDPEEDTILGRRYVTNEYFDTVCGAGFICYGNWRRGAWLRRTPMLTRVLQELYFLNSEVGYLITSWHDAHFLAELVGASQPPTWQPLFFAVLPSGSLP